MILEDVEIVHLRSRLGGIEERDCAILEDCDCEQVYCIVEV